MTTIDVTFADTPPVRGLRRNYLSLTEVFALSIGVIAPTVMPTLAAPGVYGTTGNGTWLAYLVATVALVLVAFNINAFAKREASPGALYVVVAKGCGPLTGVVAGWSLLIGYVFTAAALMTGAAAYLIVLLRQIGVGGSNLSLAIVLTVVVAAIAFSFAFRDIKLSSRMSLAIEALIVLLIIGVTGGALFVFGPVVDHAQTALVDVTPGNVRLGLVLAFFSFVGFEAATSVGAEAKQPFRTVPTAVLLSVVMSGLFFVAVAYALTAGYHRIGLDLAKADAPLFDLAKSMGLSGLGTVISAGVALSCFAGTLGSINAGCRVLYALSKHGLFHGSATRTREVTGTPHMALTTVTLVALVSALFLDVAGVGLIDGFGQLGSLASFGFIFVYILVSVGTPLYLRQKGALKPLHVILAISAIVLLTIPLYGSVYPVPAWPLNIIPYVFLGLVGAGIFYFVYLQRIAPEQLAVIEADLFHDAV